MAGCFTPCFITMHPGSPLWQPRPTVMLRVMHERLALRVFRRVCGCRRNRQGQSGGAPASDMRVKMELRMSAWWPSFTMRSVARPRTYSSASAQSTSVSRPTCRGRMHAHR